MERHMLRLTFVLGVLVTILGGTGVFAVFTDQAHTGINSVQSGARAQAADLRIAPATADYLASTVTCGRFENNTAATQFTVADLQPESDFIDSWLCLRNSGAAALSLNVGIGPLTNVDNDCTGDEAAAGDTTCGNSQAGELAERLVVHVVDVTCETFTSATTHVKYLTEIAAEPLRLRDTPLEPGETACVRLILEYDPYATEEQIQVAQSDVVQWRFGFEGTAQ